MTDPELVHIATLNTLVILDITGCHSLTDYGLLHLYELPNLVEAHVDVCHGVTQAGAAGLCYRSRID